MASTTFRKTTGHDYQKEGIIKDGLFNPLTTAQITTLAGLLGAGHKGLGVYDTDLSVLKIWNGSAFAANPVTQSGLTPKGGKAFNDTEPVAPVIGDLYIFTTAGTNTWEGSTPVEINDQVFWNGTAWEFLEGNKQKASETIQGTIELATSAEVITGTDTERAVTPAGLKAQQDSKKVARVYFVTGLTTVADTPLNIAHALALQNRDAFVGSFMVANSQEDVDWDSVDANNVTVTTSIARTGATVCIIGF